MGGHLLFESNAGARPLDSAPYRLAAAPPHRLGVGVLYNPMLAAFVRQNIDAIDFLSVVPEEFWADPRRSTVERAAAVEAALRVLDGPAADRPLIAHGMGLALGGEAPLDRNRLERIADWQARYDFRWTSEHLVAGEAAGTGHLATRLTPIACDRRALARVAERVREVQALLPVPFLLENNFYATGVPQQEMTEPTFLNRLCAATGCGIVLDIDNVHRNAIDCGIDALSYVDRVDLSRVVEIHVSARPRTPPTGEFVAASLCPPPLFDVLEAAMWRSPRLRAVTVEFSDTVVDERAMRSTLDAARRVWKLYH